MKLLLLSLVVVLGCSKDVPGSPEPVVRSLRDAAATVAAVEAGDAGSLHAEAGDAGSTADASVAGGRLCVVAASLKPYFIATLSADEDSKIGPFSVGLDDRGERLGEAGCFEDVAPGAHRVTIYAKRGAAASLPFTMTGAQTRELRGHGPSWSISR